MRLVYSFILLVLLFSCKRKKTDNILPLPKMQLVFWDVLKADALAEELVKKDSTKKLQQENIRLQKEVFAIHHTSKEAFYRSYNFYAQHTEKMQALLDSIVAYAGRNTYNNITAKPIFSLTDSIAKKESNINFLK
jgi:hypothetical protein